MEFGHLDKQLCTTQERKVPQGKISGFFSWKLLGLRSICLDMFFNICYVCFILIWCQIAITNFKILQYLGKTPVLESLCNNVPHLFYRISSVVPSAVLKNPCFTKFVNFPGKHQRWTLNRFVFINSTKQDIMLMSY